MAFILDIRRGNLQEHLLYKALFELSADRAEFLSRLFSRPRPTGLDRGLDARGAVRGLRAAAPSEDLYRANLKAVLSHLTAKHGFRLPGGDAEGIDYIYRTAFFTEGPELGYSLTNRGRLGNTPSYADLMSMRDGDGKQRSYLATEESFRFLKDLQTQNLRRARRRQLRRSNGASGDRQVLAEPGATVSAFYVSNVEQYLRQDGLWSAFCQNVKALPLDARSTFMRSTREAAVAASPRRRPARGRACSPQSWPRSKQTHAHVEHRPPSAGEVARMAARRQSAPLETRRLLRRRVLLAATLALAVSVGAWSPGQVQAPATADAAVAADRR